MKTLTQTIETTFIGSKYQGIADTTAELTAIVGKPAMFLDTYIYDGADNGEDKYILCAEFGIAKTQMEIKLTYGDTTLEIGCVEVENPIDSRKEIQRHIVMQLENLVHKRFNAETLKAELESIFNEPISLSADYEDRPEQPDWNFVFGTTQNENTKGVFDIYYLEQRVRDSNDNDLYVTEIGYLFDC